MQPGRRRGSPTATRAADFNIAILEAAFHRAGRKRVPVEAMLDALQASASSLMLQNDNVFDFPAIDLTRSMTAIEAEHVTEKLIEVQTRIEQDERIHDLFSEGLCRLFTALLDDLPASRLPSTSGAVSVPLYALRRSGCARGTLARHIPATTSCQRRRMRSRPCPSCTRAIACGRTCSTCPT